MNTTEIEKFLSKHSPNIFRGVYAIDQLPDSLWKERKFAIVINSDPADKPGKHWFVLYRTNSQVYYFCSLGRMPNRRIRNFVRQKFSSIHINNGDRTPQNRRSALCGQYCCYVIYWLSQGIPFSLVCKQFIFTKDDDTMIRNFMEKMCK